MASAATESDLLEYIEQRRTEISHRLARGNAEVSAQMAKRGTLRSSMGVRAGIEKVEAIVSTFLDEEFSSAAHWVGPALSEAIVRARLAEFGRDICETMITPRQIYKHHDVNQSTTDSLKQVLLAKVRKFELAVERAPQTMPGTTFNIIKADSIVGGIQQGQGNLTQENTVTLSTGEIQSAIDRLRSVLQQTGQDSLLKEVDDDLQTIEVQLRKETPNVTIIQEAGKSVRTIMEGAVGGMLSQPLAHALANVAVALGLS